MPNLTLIRPNGDLQEIPARADQRYADLVAAAHNTLVALQLLDPRDQYYHLRLDLEAALENLGIDLHSKDAVKFIAVGELPIVRIKSFKAPQI